MNILITGVAGNIGSALAQRIIVEGIHNIIGVDNLSTGSLKKIPKQGELFRFVKADVNEFSDMSAIFQTYGFDYVFHLAAVVGVQRTLENPLKVLRDIDGIRNILSLSKNCGIKKVFYSSSSEVYGEPVSLPQYEDSTPLNSRLPYAIVKNIGEAYCKSYFEEHGLQYNIFRFFNTYGPNQSDDFVIPRFLFKALKNEDIFVYGDGQQTRTFCYVDDNIDTMLACLNSGSVINETINIGSDIPISIADLAKLIIKITNSSSAIKFLPPLPDGDMKKRQPDISKMLLLLDRKPLDLNAGIMKLLQHYENAI